MDGRHGNRLSIHGGLAIYEMKFGTNHTDTAMTNRNIGLTLEQMGQMEEALSSFHKCISI